MTIRLSDDVETDACVCGSSRVMGLVRAGRAIDTNYPRWDGGLGVMLQSAAHRRQICRERGLIPVDGDLDMRDLLADVRLQERQQAVGDEIMTQVEHDPAFADFRRARDRGLLAAQER